jgi:hypothetical protein
MTYLKIIAWNSSRGGGSFLPFYSFKLDLFVQYLYILIFLTDLMIFIIFIVKGTSDTINGKLQLSVQLIFILQKQTKTGNVGERFHMHKIECRIVHQSDKSGSMQAQPI